MKVDVQIEENCPRTISWESILAQNFSCKKLSNQKPTANTVRNTRRTTLCWMGARLKNFHSSNLLCICPSLFETYLNKANYIIYEKLLIGFSVAGFPFWGEIRPPTPVLLTVHFSAALKALVLGNLFKVFRLDRRTGSLPLGDKDEENMTIVLFFSLSPTAKWPCACDGKSNKFE